MKANISCCLIVKNEGPRVIACLESLRPYVEEIVVVDTGSTDGTFEKAKELADICVRFTGCNDPETGLIEDFALARQTSFDLATKPWVMWVDGDDVVEGADKLFEITVRWDVARGDKNVCVAFPYHYAFDEKGNPIVTQYRERLFTPKEAFRWVNPVHEVVDMKEPSQTIFDRNESLLFIHKRGDKQIEPNRNLRILKKLYEKQGEKDARQLYYLGLEYGNVQDHGNMINMLNRYLELSGWDDEKYMACLRLGQHYLAHAMYQNAIEISLKAITLQEHWAEAYLMLAKSYYFLADIGKESLRNYQRCVNFARQGLSYPPTQTLLFVNPMDRNYEIHKFLNVALSKLGDIEGALESCELGLKANPEDPWMKANQEIYRKHISRNKINIAINQLVNENGIDQKSYQSIMDILDGKVQTLSVSQEDLNKISVPINYTAEGWAPLETSPQFPRDITKESFPVAKVTPHREAWGIPNEFEHHDLPLVLTEQQLQATVLMIWKQYLLHDEVLSARIFLENAPVKVKHTLATQKALQITKKMVDWIEDASIMQFHNSPINTMVEGGMPLPNRLEGQEGYRFYMVADRLPKERAKLVDFGCFDGCFTNRYGLLGHEVVGLDAVKTSVALANRKAKEFSTGATHIQTLFEEAADKVPNGYFDFATSTDTYEHLRDPIKEMLLPARKMLKDSGSFLLATPYESWLRGNFIHWAHPWVTCINEGQAWNAPVPRGHLIAPTVWSVTDHFRKAGYWVKDCYAKLCDPIKDVEGQGNVFAEALKIGPKAANPLDIVFFTGDGLEEWTSKTVETSGIGGSEIMVLQMAKELASLGHRVRIFNSCGQHGEGVYDGVEYLHTNKFEGIECDVVVVSRVANMLDDVYCPKYKLKLLWCHDVIAANANNRLLLKADRILALTEWHKQNLIKEHGVLAQQVEVTRNGIYLDRFNKKIERNPHRIIYSSSPDRGWKPLLEEWGKIRAEVPDAELHLFYGFKNWEAMAKVNPQYAAPALALRDQALAMKDQGVTFHDRVNQDQLAEKFLKSGVWAAGTNFTETSCISAMEAQAAGCHIVATALAALNETVGERGILLSGDCNNRTYRDQFVQHVVDALKHPDEVERQQLQKYAKEHFGMVELAKEWEGMFFRLMEEKKIHPLQPYQPTEGYRG